MEGPGAKSVDRGRYLHRTSRSHSDRFPEVRMTGSCRTRLRSRSINGGIVIILRAVFFRGWFNIRRRAAPWIDPLASFARCAEGILKLMRSLFDGERATKGNSKPTSRRAFWSNSKVQDQPALAPSP